MLIERSKDAFSSPIKGSSLRLTLIRRRLRQRVDVTLSHFTIYGTITDHTKIPLGCGQACVPEDHIVDCLAECSGAEGINRHCIHYHRSHTTFLTYGKSLWAHMIRMWQPF
jgi:hypothetical protein